jgi:predicted chitinase
MNLTAQDLTALGVGSAAAARYLPTLNEILPRYAIDHALRVAHFLAQVLHESERMNRVEENLNYSADRLVQVFPKYFKPRGSADPAAYAHQPQAIANLVYGNRMGNGDAKSGDGWRFRGRGLIQLTGRSGYQDFSTWIGADLVAAPDRVAADLAVQSAVYFWDREKLNALADVDDLTTITKRINGGLAGLADRRALLDQAKAVLGTKAPVPTIATTTTTSATATATGSAAASVPGFQPTHRVVPAQLNLRRSPEVSSATWIASLAQGTLVQVVGEGGAPGWVKVRVVLRGTLREGVVAERYLTPLTATSVPATPAALPVAQSVASPAAAARPLPAAHLAENRPDVTRMTTSGRAYPLGESGRPTRGAASAASLIEIIDYLDPADPTHVRYQPAGGSTFCNIYACDYCSLCGVYLPRVWWTADAIHHLSGGVAVDVVYGQTVTEINANGLHDWLERYGPEFGWHSEVDLTLLQEAANAGEVCVIVGKRRDLNRSGHIVAVAPEHADVQAQRDKDGHVTRPVESQAGTRNFCYNVNRIAWWSDDKFQSFAYWRHA